MYYIFIISHYYDYFKNRKSNKIKKNNIKLI